MKITVPYNTIKALLLVAAKGDVRYWLNGVLVDAMSVGGEVALVATNGHVLLAAPAVTVEDHVAGSWIVPREALDAVRGVGKEKMVTIQVTVPEPQPDPDRPGVTVQKPASIALHGAATIQTAPIDGQFPDWRRPTVLPRKPSGKHAHYDPRYVGLFAEVARLLGADYPVIYPNGNAPARVDQLNGSIGVIMPWNPGAPSQPADLPAWAVA